MIGAALAQPDLPVSRLPVLGARERAGLVAGWMGGGSDYGETRSLHRLVAEQVDRTPDAEAVCAGSTRLTYAELDRASNRLAHALIDAGCRTESVVGIALERSCELVVALLAALKTGAAFMPLDVSASVRAHPDDAGWLRLPRLSSPIRREPRA